MSEKISLDSSEMQCVFHFTKSAPNIGKKHHYYVANKEIVTFVTLKKKQPI